jgi:hypothetical protein
VGIRNIMGDKVVQYYGLSIMVVASLQVIMEEERAASRMDAPKGLEIAQLACFVFLGYARALRGEEITKIDLAGVRKYFANGAVEPKHVTLSLIGRFKQIESEQQHFLPIMSVMGSGIRIREWVERLLQKKARVGLTSEFLFLKKDGTPVKAIAFEEALLERLEWIQQNMMAIIPLNINLWEEFGMRRLMQRGATTEASNAGIDGWTQILVDYVSVSIDVDLINVRNHLTSSRTGSKVAINPHPFTFRRHEGAKNGKIHYVIASSNTNTQGSYIHIGTIGSVKRQLQETLL